MWTQNPTFYYVVQLDSKEQITNILWADTKMIIDYVRFGDVMTFHTRYDANKELRPISIFGIALLHDETNQTM